MALETKAFDLTAEEKHAALGHIRALVLAAGALLARAKKSPAPSPHDYSDALHLLNRALFMATDADACDASLAPLATCHLYKGDILLALNRVAEAREAYEAAATAQTTPPPLFTETGAASRDEATCRLAKWDETLRAAPWEKLSVPAEHGCLVDGTPGEIYAEAGPDGTVLLATRRPGPAKSPRAKMAAFNPDLL